MLCGNKHYLFVLSRAAERVACRATLISEKWIGLGKTRCKSFCWSVSWNCVGEMAASLLAHTCRSALIPKKLTQLARQGHFASASLPSRTFYFFQGSFKMSASKAYQSGGAVLWRSNSQSDALYKQVAFTYRISYNFC